MKLLEIPCLIFALILVLVIFSVRSEADKVKEEMDDCGSNRITSGGVPNNYTTTILPLTDLERVYIKSDIIGNTTMGGTYFDDDIENNKFANISNIRVYANTYAITGIEITYRLDNGTPILRKHNSNISKSYHSELHFGHYQHILGARVCILNGYIIRLNVSYYDMHNKFYSHWSGGLLAYGDVFQVDGDLRGFFGVIDQNAVRGLGFYGVKKSAEGPKFGGPGGNSWSDPIINMIQPIVKVDKIVIYSGSSIDAIQVDYLTPWGALVKGEKHGGNGGTPTTIDIRDDEVLVGIETKSSESLLGSVTFYTKMFDGRTIKYGPYGSSLHDDITGSVYGRIAGFYGTEGDVLDSLGVYTIDC